MYICKFQVENKDVKLSEEPKFVIQHLPEISCIIQYSLIVLGLGI